MIKIVLGGESPSMQLAAGSAAPADTREGHDRLAYIFRTHVDFVWRTARRFGLSTAEADDAAQQVFLVASKKLDIIPDGQEKSFLFGTAMNVARTMVRSRQRRREDLVEASEATDTQPHPEAMLERAQARDTVHRILQSMPDDLRVVFILFELEEMTMAEVAALLAIPAGTVASRIRRARQVFRTAATGNASNGEGAS